MKTPHKHADNSASTKVPHKHAELIKQWADGAIIEVAIPKNYASDCIHRFDAWMETKNPEWNPQKQYRVKPEPKPNVVRYVCLDIDCNARVNARSNYFSGAAHRCDNLMVVFDGETGKLKDAQVLASSGE